jgi:hypothetical protein
MSHDVYLWDALTGELLRPPVRHPARVESAALSPNGRYLVLAGEHVHDRQVRIWHLVPDPSRGAARQRLARLVSGQEVQGSTVVPVAIDRQVADWRQLRRANPGLLEPSANLINQWYDRHGSRLIGSEAWASAARQYDLLAARQPDNPWWHYVACGCALAADDRATLRRHAEAMLQLSQKAADLFGIDRTIKSCLLLPDVLPDAVPAFRLAARLEKTNPRDHLAAWNYLARGLAFYRERPSRPADAAVWLEKARASPTKQASCDVLAGLFLAMARKQQGRADEAQKLLAESTRTMEGMEKQPWSFYWLDRVHCRVVLREATKTVGER